MATKEAFFKQRGVFKSAVKGTENLTGGQPGMFNCRGVCLEWEHFDKYRLTMHKNEAPNDFSVLTHWYY